MQTPARYFPVQPGPLKMRAGLYRFGADFGNGSRDTAYFQGDSERLHYRQAKIAVLERWPDRLQAHIDKRNAGLHAAVLDWMRLTIVRELALPLPEGCDYAVLARAVQEDFVVIEIPPEGDDRVLAVAVCFPSGWRPECLLERSIAEIHTPVPGLHMSNGLVRALVAKPFVRFVWTVTGDAELDHHPDVAYGLWTGDQPGYLRVERQVTVPFPDWSALLFLIRTYIYPFTALNLEQRDVLSRALRQMPSAIVHYKNLAKMIPYALAGLESLNDDAGFF